MVGLRPGRRKGNNIIGIARRTGPTQDIGSRSGTPGRTLDASKMTVWTRITCRSASARRSPLKLALAGAALALGLAACGSFTQHYQRGYVLPEGALEQIQIGAPQEQVMLVLGTPSTVATVSGEAFYYISQRSEQAAAFVPQRVTDQRVVAVYFDKNRRVERLANYGVRDGKVFDFISRTTPSGGQELNYLGYLFNIVPKI
jgi:outer membrane protein assembly factor BamE (lipoprotein component of BamABCDE complex)